MHRTVCVAKKMVRFDAVIGEERDSDACCHEQLMALEFHGLADRGQELLCDHACRIDVPHAGHENREVVASETCDRVNVAGGTYEALRHDLQQLVAAMVPEAVVDLLEGVEVKHH